MKKIKIYLAGKMAGLSFEEMNNWRKHISGLLIESSIYCDIDLNIINPVDYYNFEEKRYKTQKEVMLYDLQHVKTSDIVIANIANLSTSIGSCIELYEAYTKQIPVIAFGNLQEYENLHPWVKECIIRFEETDKQIAKYIRDFYFI